MRAFRSIAEVKPPQLPGVRGLLSLAVGVVVVAALAIAKEVFIPITLAVLLSFILAPLVGLLTKIHVPRFFSVLISALLAIILFALLGSLIGSQFAGLAHNLPSYATRIETKITTLQQETIGRLALLTKNLPIQFLPKPGRQKPTATPPLEEPRVAPPPRPESDPTSLAVAILLPVLTPIVDAAIVGIVAIFILVYKNDLRDRIIRLFGTRDLHRTTVAMDEAARRLSHYFLAQLVVNTGFGVIIGCGLAIIGVPSAILFGTLAGLLRFVPYFGIVLGAVLPAALAAAASPEWAMMWWTLALFGVVEFVTGQFVEPVLYGNTTGLSPLSIVVATIFWAWLWGPIGLLLATPLTLCLVVLGRYVDHLEFLDVLFGDQPALTPVENFYQRMLANDPDEAFHQADTLIKEMPLAAYYDDVAIEGLRLALHDAERDVLDSENLDRLKCAVLSLIDDLEEYDECASVAEHDNGPATGNASKDTQVKSSEPAQSAGGPDASPAMPPIFCIPGRGVFDEIVAQIFIQLLHKRNISARLIPSAFAATRSQPIADSMQPSAVCVIYLEIRDHSTAARAMVRRIRNRMPDLPIILGLLTNSNGGKDLTEAEFQEDVYTVSSLQEGLAHCLDLVSAESGRSLKLDEPCDAVRL